MQHVFNKVLIFLTFNIQILRLRVASVYNVQDQVGPTLPLPFVPNAPNIQSLRFKRRSMRTFVETNRNLTCITPSANGKGGAKLRKQSVVHDEG